MTAPGAGQPNSGQANSGQARAGELNVGSAKADLPAPEERRVFVALGSNLGDRWANLGAGLAELPGVVAVSSVYETEPVGGPPGQGPYLNMVAELRTSAAPLELLGVARRAEALAGRARTVRWGPRTLDVDILLVGDLVVDVPELQVPHPRMWERGFVLVPLADLAPEIVAGRLDDRIRSGVVMAGTLGPGRWSGDQPQKSRAEAGQAKARQGDGRQERGCQEQ